MARTIADILQLVGVVVLVAAAWTVNVPVGLVATGVACLATGVVVELTRGGDR
ncbi:MAG: hypothetical protein ACKO04_12895 [Actinomycetes bacterium]